MIHLLKSLSISKDLNGRRLKKKEATPKLASALFSHQNHRSTLYDDNFLEDSAVALSTLNFFF
jgi:hypothetical protein